MSLEPRSTCSSRRKRPFVLRTLLEELLCELERHGNDLFEVVKLVLEGLFEALNLLFKRLFQVPYLLLPRSA
jgi:hypothetical protein